MADVPPIGSGPDVYEYVTPATGAQINESTAFTVKVIAPTRDVDKYQLQFGIIPDDPMAPIAIIIPLTPPTTSDPDGTYLGHQTYTYSVTAPAVTADAAAQLQFLYRVTTLDPFVAQKNRTVIVKNV